MPETTLNPKATATQLARGYAVQNATAPLTPFQFERREVRPNDVQIQILYCGVCHSDLHQARNEWGNSIYPMVPGHEIVGRVTKVGKQVTRFNVGDLAGVGCLVDSCRHCASCQEGLEQYCENHWVGTYNSLEKDGKTPTYGGYSNMIVVDEMYTLRIPTNLELARVAPLLCAGITTYSPLRHWKVKAGDKVGVVGLGGLGHMAVKLAAAMGADVSVLSTSAEKEMDARDLGAHHFVLTNNLQSLERITNHFDLIINTVSAPHDINQYTALLRRDGTMVMLGAPPLPPQLNTFNLIFGRKKIGGSLIGGIQETQEMLDFCGEHNIVSDIELIRMEEINEAYERMLRGDVKYRFVIDLATL